ncbi:MAG: hypothetical protein ACI4RF_04115, partial [Eubacterium sp.]
EEFQPYDVSFEQIKAARSEKMLEPSKAMGIVIKTQKKEYTLCLAFKELHEPFGCNGKIGSGIISVFENDKIIFSKW